LAFPVLQPIGTAGGMMNRNKDEGGGGDEGNNRDSRGGTPKDKAEGMPESLEPTMQNIRSTNTWRHKDTKLPQIRWKAWVELDGKGID
jgi:hypothetical protein